MPPELYFHEVNYCFSESNKLFTANIYNNSDYEGSENRPSDAHFCMIA